MPVAALPYIATAAGIGASLYGANKQSKDQAGANAENRAAVEAGNQAEWQNYLMQRGVYAPGTPTGTMPAGAASVGPGGAVNARLPLWANMSFTPTGTAPGSVVRRKTPRV